MDEILIAVKGGIAEIQNQTGNTSVIFIDWDEEQEINTIHDGFLNNNRTSVIVCGEGCVWEVAYILENVKVELLDYD
ncbi:hypothetical protein JCM19047_719 [Bacillus sp. JCM 19047]|nr:hypothetical protein JCM19047_719 [Bacillus sp. JCM 19047]